MQSLLRSLERSTRRQDLLSARQPDDRRRDTSERDGNRRAAHGGAHHFRDGLRPASTDLTPILFAIDTRDLDRDNQFVRLAHARPIARVERRERNAPLGIRALENDHRTSGREHRKGIAGRRGIGDVAPERAAVLNLTADYFWGGGKAHWQPAEDAGRLE